MAMNKAEKARMEQLERELAFRWPTAAEPQPMTRSEIEASRVEVTSNDRSVHKTRLVALGYCMNAYSGTVDKMWSDGHLHGRGNHTGDGASQHMGVMYRTPGEAALAMRWQMCRNFAAKLRTVDLLIQTQEQPA